MYQSSNQRDFARELRTKATEQERLLWSQLRKRQLLDCRFRRQFAIGPYVVDFECFERLLIVELDGGQHNTLESRDYDAKRTTYLEQRGYRVLRFWNSDIADDFDAVLEAIAKALVERAPGRPHPGPPPEGEGELGGYPIE
ncbi:hypothetical protein Pla108_28490 [Botrimarina colliarenosi]|uniref:DUF559 domain-containing protein n=1 Tax=Botrimarina colliarenosi TaxID=2528001 RepID=A0A5C6AAL1_9BACT|nr:endonuclease domain-containing protein [Botrimarina colliarenosi]TWT97072.1 hypothetical protein Pla108_28490 [Botrimarina colliarenosi]